MGRNLVSGAFTAGGLATRPGRHRGTTHERFASMVAILRYKSSRYVGAVKIKAMTPSDLMGLRPVLAALSSLRARYDKTSACQEEESLI